ncbi:hypothetical protein MUN82_03625 [Hymenobacter aerilatus]|uniref:Uncharacterized protein n=1 Tax=Hymenobacter aerilatus TaxID=2932251 RepID=A0A8T9T0Z4_9BACT|nr:hypothetical protein [Hymenobacter aerilatus]UOR06190.1 hypothetical protein MUN82_03625 [Hymenobacter aerilatus]
MKQRLALGIGGGRVGLMVSFGLLMGHLSTAQLLSKPSEGLAAETLPAGYVRIPNTRLLLLPPTGFGTAPGFAGLRHGNDAVQVYELPTTNYYTNAASFGPAKITARGGKVLSDEQVQVQGYPARLIWAEPQPTRRSYQLAFGDSAFAVLLTTTPYPAADTATGTALRRALLSARYERGMAADPFARLGFTLDDKASRFAFARQMGNQLIYTRAGSRVEPLGNEPVVTVIPMPFSSAMTAADVAEDLITTLRQYGLTEYTVRRTATTHPHELESYEVEAYGKLRGHKVLIFQQITVLRNTAIALEGIARDDYETNLTEFRKLTQSIRKK